MLLRATITIERQWKLNTGKKHPANQAKLSVKHRKIEQSARRALQECVNITAMCDSLPLFPRMSSWIHWIYTWIRWSLEREGRKGVREGGKTREKGESDHSPLPIPVAIVRVCVLKWSSHPVLAPRGREKGEEEGGITQLLGRIWSTNWCADTSRRHYTRHPACVKRGLGPSGRFPT